MYVCVVCVFILTSSLVGRTETNFQFARIELPLAGMLIRLLLSFFSFFCSFLIRHYRILSFEHIQACTNSRANKHTDTRTFIPLVSRPISSFLGISVRIYFSSGLLAHSSSFQEHIQRVKISRAHYFFFFLFFLTRPVDQSSVIEITDRRTSDKWSEHDSKA